MDTFLRILLTSLIWLGLTLLIAFPLMYIWNDAVVNTFPGVKQVDLLHAWGLFILFNVVTKTEIKMGGTNE